MEAIAGILFGAIGAFIAIGSYVRTMRKDWQQQLDREIDRKADAEVKKFAAERDFAHLKRNYEQLQQSLNFINQQIDEQEKTMIEMKTNLTGMYHQLQNLASRFDASTSGFRLPGRKDEDDDRG